MNQFLHSEYNGLSDSQLKIILGLEFKTCRASPDISCKLDMKRPCQCVAFYKANGQLPPFTPRKI